MQFTPADFRAVNRASESTSSESLKEMTREDALALIEHVEAKDYRKLRVALTRAFLMKHKEAGSEFIFSDTTHTASVPALDEKLSAIVVLASEKLGRDVFHALVHEMQQIEASVRS